MDIEKITQKYGRNHKFHPRMFFKGKKMSFLAKNREFQVRIVTFWTRNSWKITKNACFYIIFLHKIAQKDAKMYVETSSIHQYGKILINSIETFLSTFEFSQSHIISYLPKVLLNHNSYFALLYDTLSYNTS